MCSRETDKFASTTLFRGGYSFRHGMKIDTLAVHAGSDVDPDTGAVVPPIHLSTTFEHGPAGEETHGYSYIREKNPTQSRLEQALAQLDSGEAGAVFSSGMAAGVAVLQTMPLGSHVVFPDDIYVTFRRLSHDFLPKWGIQSTAIDLQNHAELKAAIRPNTRLVWVETPSNPLMKILDIKAVSEIAHASRSKRVMDRLP